MIWAMLLAGCGGAGTPEATATERHAPDATAARVEVARLERSSAASMTMSLPGEVEGSQDVVLASALGGQVEAVLVGKGEPVRAGQAIARVDAEIYLAQRDQAQAQRDQAATELSRLEGLGDLATDAQLLQARTQLQVAEAQLRIARAQLGRAVVTAPFGGIAADVFPGRGEFLGPGSAVARLVQLDPARVTLSVADRDVVSLEPGMEVTVTTGAQSGQLRGIIEHVGRAADQRTRAFPVDVAVPNPDGRLLPGMIATVQVHRALAEGTISLPQGWIVSRRDGQGVFVVDDGYARWKPVELGDVLHDQVVVRSGVALGDRLVVTGQRDLAEGDRVLVSREGACCESGRVVFGE